MPKSDFEIENGILWRYKGSAKHVVIPKAVTRIALGAFYKCEAESIVIPKSVVSIENEAFYLCYELKKIFIPEHVKEIGEKAFLFCHNLRKIDVSAKNPYFKSYDNILYDKQSGELLFCPEKKTSAVLWKHVTKIGAGAFFRCDIQEEIIIPDTVTSIGENAFKECRKLKKVYLPQSVTEIGACAFYLCNMLKEIDLPEHLTQIKKMTFASCGLGKINIPDSVTKIESYAFFNCRFLEDIRLSENITAIEKGTFSWCRNLKTVRIPDNITSLSTKAFEHAGLQSIHYQNMEFPLSSSYELVYILRFLGFVPVAPKMNPDKCHTLLNLYFHYPSDEKISAYIRTCFRSMIPFLFDDKNKDFLKKIIEQKIFLRKSNIERLIQCSVENGTAEITIPLIDYKEKYIGYDDSEESIRKKFKL